MSRVNRAVVLLVLVVAAWMALQRHLGDDRRSTPVLEDEVEIVAPGGAARP